MCVLAAGRTCCPEATGADSVNGAVQTSGPAGRTSPGQSLLWKPKMDTVHRQVVAVMLATGSGEREAGLGGEAFLPLRGKPVLAHSLAVFQASRAVDSIVVVVQPADEARCRALLARERLSKVGAVILGGASRAESEYRALQTLRAGIEGRAIELVLIHDAAHPVPGAHLLEWLVEGAAWSDGCLPAVRPPCLLTELAAHGQLAATCAPRRDLRPQSPWAFDARLLLGSYDRARAAGLGHLDALGAMRRAGHEVRVIPGDLDNVAIATPDDLLQAEALLAERAPVPAAAARSYTNHRVGLRCVHCRARTAHRLEFLDGLLATACCERCGRDVADAVRRTSYLTLWRRRLRSKPRRLVGEVRDDPGGFLRRMPRRCTSKPFRVLRDTAAELRRRAAPGWQRDVSTAARGR